MSSPNQETLLYARRSGGHYHVPSCSRVELDPKRYGVVFPEWEPRLVPCPDCIRLNTWQLIVGGNEGTREALARDAETQPSASLAAGPESEPPSRATPWPTTRTRRGIRRPRLFAPLPPR